MSENNDIKHIVLSGGGHVGVTQCSIVKHLCENKFINMDNIESIYAASAGSIIGVILCLNPNFNDLMEYIIDRPWQDSIDLGISNFFNFYQQKGIFNDEIFVVILKSLLYANDLHIYSTLTDLYNKSNIELNIFSTKMEDFTAYKVNHISHPNMTIIQAVHMSSAIPFVFQPVFYNDSCFMDGGIVNNYPLETCLQEKKCNKFEVVAINNNIQNKRTDIHKLLPSSNVLDVCLVFFSHYNVLRRELKEAKKIQNKHEIPYEIQTYTNGITINDLYLCATEKDKRKQLLQDGKIAAQSFLKYLNNFTSSINDKK